MKKIGTMASNEDHEAFSRLLTGKGVDFQSDSVSDGVEFWAIEEEDHQAAQDLLSAFRDDPKSSAWSESLAKGKKVEVEEKREELKKKVRVGAFKVKHSGQGTKVSLFLIYVSVAIYVLIYLNPVLWEEVGNWAIFLINGPDGGIASGQVWRVVTPIFLHFPIMNLPLHILFNCLWMLSLGRSLERSMGSLFMVKFVIVVGGLSNLLQFMISGPLFGGLSGVVYGLLGYIWVRSRRDPSFGPGVHPQTMLFMMIWLVMGLGMSRIANGAHFGGLAIGALLAFIDLKRKKLI